jgi:hypothetical protein
VVEVVLRADQKATLYALAPKDIVIEHVMLEFAGLCRACRSASPALMARGR